MSDLIKNNQNAQAEADFDAIYKDIREHILSAQAVLYQQANIAMLRTYWYIGSIAYNLSGENNQENYGKNIIKTLSARLVAEFGSGYSPVSLWRMRKFYEMYPEWSDDFAKLSWAHYQQLIKIDRKEEREFYRDESINSNWSYRELGRQINTKLYDRLLVAPNKQKLLADAEKHQLAKQPKELLKTPYIFEFAGLKENKKYLETDLERALIDHLAEFLLELGRGFAFVGSQQRIKIGDDYFYPDLVFYNWLAKCFVIFDLKIGTLTHQDVGQMQMYVNYYKKTQMAEGDNEPIGVLLCANKNDAAVEMTLGDDIKNVYASNYLTYLPSKEELIRIIQEQKALIELSLEDETE